MEASPDVLVIGGGIIGLTAALELASAGLTVEVADDARQGRASIAGAGIIPPGRFDHAATPFDRLRAWSSEEFRRRYSTGCNFDYLINGGYEYGVEPERVQAWRDEGIDARFQGDRWYLPGMARLRNDLFVDFLRNSCLESGITLTRSTTSSIPDDKLVLVAGGAWSVSLLKPLGVPLELYPVRGQIILYAPGILALGEKTIIDGKRYLVPRSDGSLLVGSTEEPEAGFVSETTPQGIDGLRTFAESFDSSLRFHEPVRSWAGLRPALADPVPYICRVPNHENVVLAVGHFRAGTQLSLGTARLVTDLMLDRKPLVDPAMFALGRPPLGDVQLAFQS